MYLLLEIFFITLVQIALFFTIAKPLTKNRRFNLKETTYFVLASLLIVAAQLLNNNIGPFNVFVRPLSDLIFVLLLFIHIPLYFLYFAKIKSYSLKKAVILTSFAYLFISILDTISISLRALLFANITEPAGLVGLLAWHSSYLLLITVEAVILITLFVKATEKLRRVISQDNFLQTILMFCCILSMLFLTGMALSRRYFWWIVTNQDSLHYLVAIVAVISIIFVSFYFCARIINKRYEQQRTQDEQKNLIYYMNELEQQQSAMRKFKHDYQNILLSLDNYIEEQDWDGLEQYYSTTIRTTAGIINKNAFALEALSKIKVREVKSIFAAKLMMAQNMNLGIDTIFEANAEIDHIPVDSCALVRKLGIIMDNAIEALAELGGGSLFVGCFKQETEVTFIVQNACRPDLPALHKLWQPGFSTKGKDRGLGLSNLLEMVNAHPNVRLETDITEGNFVQRLSISRGEV